MEKRIKKIRKILSEKNLDAILVTTAANVTYLTNFDFLSPTEREAYIFITKRKQYIISSFLYKEELVRTAPHFIFLDVSSARGKPFWEYIKEIAEKEKLGKIGFEADNLTVAEYNVLRKQYIILSPLSISSIRFEKDAEEIAITARACTIGDNAFKKIQSHIKPGITEKEVALQLDMFVRRERAEPSFTTIVAFGKNAAVPHHKTNNTRLQKNDIILLDFGAKVDNYCSDMSRTLFIGNPTTKEKRAYETLLAAQQKALDFLKNYPVPTAASAVDKIARDYLIEKGFPNFPHSLGHSIGIEDHDGFRLSPISKILLTEGMVFSIEPGIYFPGEFGMRIEDIVVLTKNGPQILTKSSKELLIV